MQGTPLISVIMPVFNAERYLREAVNSILAQTCGDFELICVNDGSTDQTIPILEEYRRRDERVVILNRAHSGIVGALNDGLARSRGEFVARMDADDIILPSRFQRQLEFLQENADHVAVGCQAILMDQDGNSICVKKDTLFEHEEIDQAHLNFGWPIVHPATMFRRAALDAIGGYRTKYQWLEDLDLYIRLAEIGKIANLPDVLFFYRQNFSGVCFTRYEEQEQLRQAMYTEASARRNRIRETDQSQAGESVDSVDPAEVQSRITSRARRDVHLKWGWWALKSGFVKTARRHAMKRLRLSPLSVESWRLAYCTARGR